jgi:hypothetical protein
MNSVAAALPERIDGSVLKSDLVLGDSSHSLLPPSDPLDVVRYFVTEPATEALPMPSPAALRSTEGLWPARAEEILAIADGALERKIPIGDELITILGEAVEPADFLTLSARHPAARLHLVSANPQLLDGPGLEDIKEPELGKLLDHLPDDPDLAGRVLDRLLDIDDLRVSEMFVARFPELTAQHVFDAVARQVSGSDFRLPQRWVSAAGPVLRPMLPTRMLDRVNTTSALAACIFLLNLNVSAGLEAPIVEWAAAVSRARDDIEGQTKQRLMAYLLALALARPSKGCEPLFEYAFDPVHREMAGSRLPYDAFSALAAYLPSLYWWQQWDTCLRLRKAVAEAYAENGLDPDSFRKLTSDRETFDSLVDLAADAKQGRRFVKRLGSAPSSG